MQKSNPFSVEAVGLSVIELSINEIQLLIGLVQHQSKLKLTHIIEHPTWTAAQKVGRVIIEVQASTTVQHGLGSFAYKIVEKERAENLPQSDDNLMEFPMSNITLSLCDRMLSSDLASGLDKPIRDLYDRHSATLLAKITKLLTAPATDASQKSLMKTAGELVNKALEKMIGGGANFGSMPSPGKEVTKESLMATANAPVPAPVPAKKEEKVAINMFQSKASA
jgi:hypothetical protein